MAVARYSNVMIAPYSNGGIISKPESTLIEEGVNIEFSRDGLLMKLTKSGYTLYYQLFKAWDVQSRKLIKFEETDENYNDKTKAQRKAIADLRKQLNGYNNGITKFEKKPEILKKGRIYNHGKEDEYFVEVETRVRDRGIEKEEYTVELSWKEKVMEEWQKIVDEYYKY